MYIGNGRVNAEKYVFALAIINLTNLMFIHFPISIVLLKYSVCSPSSFDHVVVINRSTVLQANFT